MCGIAGVVGPDAGHRTEAMLDLLHHRGPDDRGLFVGPGVAIGATRLSVIDVEGGHQPLSNEDGTVHCALNGEIYNFAALRSNLEAKGHVFRTRSDTEVLVHLYEEYDVDLVHALDGMYAFSIWDASRGRLLLARDRLGEKPLFVHHDAAEIAFASELSALRASLTRRLHVDPVSLDLFFALGYTPGTRTIVTGAERILPGCLATWTGDAGIEVCRYWDVPLRPRRRTVDEGSLVPETVDVLRRAVESRMVSDVPLGVFLSGGLDSTLVTALAAQVAGERLKTFSVGYDVGSVSETEVAERVARTIGTEHRSYTLRSADVGALATDVLGRLDEPVADPALLALAGLSSFARRHVTVALGGEGADELFGGYPRYRAMSRLPRGRAAELAASRVGRRQLPERARQVVSSVAAGSVAGAHAQWVAGRRMAERPALYGPRLSDLSASDPGEHLTSSMPGEAEDTAARLMRLDTTYWLADDVLVKADRASMLASLELRAPFLAREVVELSASIPSSFHLARGGKHLLRSALDRALPDVASARKKVAFRVPLAHWLRAGLRRPLEQQLEESWIYEDGWFDRSAVRARLSEHLTRKADHAQLLYPLLVLGCWSGGAG